MYRDILIQVFRFVFIMALQVFVVNQILQYNLVNPFIYPLFILILPVNTSFFWVLSLSFAIGVVADLFQMTAGIHAAATVFMGFLRIFFLNTALSKENFEKNISPNIQNKGLTWFTIYAMLLLAVHHFVLYLLEVLTFNEFFYTSLKAILSAAASLLIIILLEYLLTPTGKKK